MWCFLTACCRRLVSWVLALALMGGSRMLLGFIRGREGERQGVMFSELISNIKLNTSPHYFWPNSARPVWLFLIYRCRNLNLRKIKCEVLRISQLLSRIGIQSQDGPTPNAFSFLYAIWSLNFFICKMMGSWFPHCFPFQKLIIKVRSNLMQINGPVNESEGASSLRISTSVKII